MREYFRASRLERRTENKRESEVPQRRAPTADTEQKGTEYMHWITTLSTGTGYLAGAPDNAHFDPLAAGDLRVDLVDRSSLSRRDWVRAGTGAGAGAGAKPAWAAAGLGPPRFEAGGVGTYDAFDAGDSVVADTSMLVPCSFSGTAAAFAGGADPASTAPDLVCSRVGTLPVSALPRVTTTRVDGEDGVSAPSLLMADRLLGLVPGTRAAGAGPAAAPAQCCG